MKWPPPGEDVLAAALAALLENYSVRGGGPQDRNAPNTVGLGGGGILPSVYTYPSNVLGGYTVREKLSTPSCHVPV